MHRAQATGGAPQGLGAAEQQQAATAQRAGQPAEPLPLQVGAPAGEQVGGEDQVGHGPGAVRPLVGQVVGQPVQGLAHVAQRGLGAGCCGLVGRAAVQGAEGRWPVQPQRRHCRTGQGDVLAQVGEQGRALGHQHPDVERALGAARARHAVEQGACAGPQVPRIGLLRGRGRLQGHGQQLFGAAALALQGGHMLGEVPAAEPRGVLGGAGLQPAGLQLAQVEAGVAQHGLNHVAQVSTGLGGEGGWLDRGGAGLHGVCGPGRSRRVAQCCQR